jgi:hypothetical protein
MKNKNTVKVQIPTPKYDDLVMGEGGWDQINTDKALATVKDQEIELYETKNLLNEAILSAKSLELKYNKLIEEIEDIKLEKYSEGYGDGYATGASDEAFYHTGL